MKEPTSFRLNKLQPSTQPPSPIPKVFSNKYTPPRTPECNYGDRPQQANSYPP